MKKIEAKPSDELTQEQCLARLVSVNKSIMDRALNEVNRRQNHKFRIRELSIVPVVEDKHIRLCMITGDSLLDEMRTTGKTIDQFNNALYNLIVKVMKDGLRSRIRFKKPLPAEID